MAVQAQYLDNNTTTNLYNRLMLDKMFGEIQTMQDKNQEVNAQSELTSCIASASKKRCREIYTPAGQEFAGAGARTPEAAVATTSGRAFAASSPLLSQQIVAHLYNQNMEIDALVRLQSDALRCEMQEARKRHLRTMVGLLEQRASKKLREKEAELEAERRRTFELEERIRQVAGEREVWMSIARNNEAVVGGLRSAIEQLLDQNNAGAGDGDECSPVFAAEDAESCCFEPEREYSGGRRLCRACGVGDVSRLVLPCRHLCLCEECEGRVDTCPVCRAAKNACLQVFMA